MTSTSVKRSTLKEIIQRHEPNALCKKMRKLSASSTHYKKFEDCLAKYVHGTGPIEDAEMYLAWCIGYNIILDNE